MFTRALVITLTCIGGLGCWVGFKTCHVTNSDRQAFQAMLTHYRRERNADHPLTQQNKHGVIKEAYFSDDSGRRHTKIAAQSATLRVVPIGNHYELIERMENINGYVEEAEGMRLFQSRDGTYYYNTHEFVSKSVAMQMVRDDAIVLNGLVKQLKLSFRDRQTRIEADQMQAHIPNIEAVR
ncbi:MAG: hypothetical protein KDK50_03285 [Chlamydiia bacterium]|nr:hypothetical protein [Chlamydiia bacterium]